MGDSSATARNAHELRLVKELLWDVVGSCLKPAERDEVRRAIGWTLTAENDAMFAEAAALAGILGEVQLSTEALLDRHKLCSNPQRNLVEAEVRLLMDQLREVASAAPFSGSAVKSRDPDAVIPKANGSEKAVFNYVAAVGTLGPDSRPRTPSTRPTSAASPTRPGTASSTSSRGSGTSSGCDPRSVVQTVQGKLNVWDIDAVKGHLQQALQDEHAALMEDIQYLQSLLEGETDRQARAELPAPSIQELKEYGSKLKKVLADEEQRVVHEVRVSRMFSAAEETEQSKAARLRGMVQASRGAGPASGGGTAGTSSAQVPPRQRSAEAHGSNASSSGGGAASSNGGGGATSSGGGISTRRSYTPPGAESLAPVVGPTGIRVQPLSRSPQQSLDSPLERRTFSPGAGRGPSSSGAEPSDSGGGWAASVLPQRPSILASPSLLGSQPVLGSPSAAKQDLAAASPLRLKPLPEPPGGQAPSALPQAAAAAATLLGPGSKGSLPPKGQLQPMSRHTGKDPRHRSSQSAGTRRSTSLGRPAATSAAEGAGTPTKATTQQPQQQPAVASSSSGHNSKAAKGGAGSPGATLANGRPNGTAASHTVNLLDALDAEVEAMLKGGVGAILAKHNRPQSAR